MSSEDVEACGVLVTILFIFAFGVMVGLRLAGHYLVRTRRGRRSYNRMLDGLSGPYPRDEVKA